MLDVFPVPVAHEILFFLKEKDFLSACLSCRLLYECGKNKFPIEKAKYFRKISDETEKKLVEIFQSAVDFSFNAIAIKVEPLLKKISKLPLREKLLKIGKNYDQGDIKIGFYNHYYDVCLIFVALQYYHHFSENDIQEFDGIVEFVKMTILYIYH